MKARPAQPIYVSTADATFLEPVMRIMNVAFDPCFGEAWSNGQLATMLASPLARLLVADLSGRPAGFALTRAVADETELLLIAVRPDARGRGIGARLLDEVIAAARMRESARLFLEVRACNPAIALYAAHGFRKVGERRDYYRGSGGQLFDAHSYSLVL